MAVQWRRVCFTMMTVNAVLMLATLAVTIVWFTQPRAPPSPCPPDPGMTSARVSSLAPPSTAESDFIKLTRETIQQAVEEKQKNYQEAEYFRTKVPQGLKPHALVWLKQLHSFKGDKKLLWNSNHTQPWLQGFEYDQRGYLHTLVDGYYYIYTHLHYTDKSGNEFFRGRLVDYVSKTEKRFVDDPKTCERMKKKLLFNEQTPCRVVSPAIPRISSTQGAVVYLNRDDMLSVASKFPASLHSEATPSYFGAHLL